MKVRAKMEGYYEHLRRYPIDSANARAGEPFEINPDHFSHRWMEKVDEEETSLRSRPKGEPVPLRKPKALKHVSESEVI